MKKYDLKDYKYIMADYADLGWEWFVLFRLDGMMVRGTFFGLSHPPGITQEILDGAVKSFQEALQKQEIDKLFGQAFPLEKFVNNIEMEFGGEIESHQRALKEILEGVERLEEAVANGEAAEWN